MLIPTISVLALIPLAPISLQDTDEIHAPGETFHIRSLWRSERGLSRYAEEGLAICEAVARAAGRVEVEPRIEIGLAENSRALRTLDPKAPPQALAVEAVPFDGRQIPAVAVWPKLHDRALFRMGLPTAPKRQLAVTAARELLQRAFPDEIHPLRRAVSLAQQGLEDSGASKGWLEEPWTASGVVSLLEALPETLTPEERRSRFVAILDGLDDPKAVSIPAGGAFAATAAEGAALLMAQVEGGDVDAALSRLVDLTPRWRMESGAIGSHEFGWQATATLRSDALVLTADPVEDVAYSITSEFYLLSNDLRVSPQADLVFGDQGGDRFLLACNSREGIYLFRRRGPGLPYEGLAERKESKVPVAERLQVRIDVDGDRINCTVGGVKLDPVRVGDRDLGGSFGFGAHQGGSVLFRDLTLTAR